MQTTEVVSLAAWISLFPYPIFIYLFYCNRFAYPIKGRSPRIAVLQALFIYLFATGQFLTMSFNLDCQVGNWILYYSGLWAQLCFNYRLVQLLFNYEITQNISELKDTRKLTDWQSSWFTANRYIAQDKFMVRLALVIFSTDIIITIFFSALVDSICSNAQGSAWSAVFSVKGVISLVLSVCMAIRMRNYPKDAFGIKSEFRSMIIGSFLVIIIVFTIAYAVPSLKWVANVGLILACQPMLFFTVVIPFKDSKKKGLNKTESLSLDVWLTRPEGIKQFRLYLETEFSSENLLFYLDVVYFKSLSLNDMEKIKDEISQIYEKFFRQESPCALNLPSDIVEETANQVQQLLATSCADLKKMEPNDILNIWDRAQTDIYKLMASDSFCRFQQTSVFQRVKDSINKNSEKNSGKSKSLKDSKEELDKLLGPQEAALDAVNVIREEVKFSPHSSPSKGMDFSFEKPQHSSEIEISSIKSVSNIGGDHTEPSTPSLTSEQIAQRREEQSQMSSDPSSEPSTPSILVEQNFPSTPA